VVLPLTTVTRREGLIKTTSQLWPTCVLGIADAGSSSFRIKGGLMLGTFLTQGFLGIPTSMANNYNRLNYWGWKKVWPTTRATVHAWWRHGWL